MGDATERLTVAEGAVTELDDLDIAIGNGQYAILALRRKGGNQVETFQIATERLRSACRVLLDKQAVEELREVRKQLSEIEKAVPLSQEIANQIFDMLAANYRLEIREVE